MIFCFIIQYDYNKEPEVLILLALISYINYYIEITL